jgi:hypothetical protein
MRRLAFHVIPAVQTRSSRVGGHHTQITLCITDAYGARQASAGKVAADDWFKEQVAFRLSDERARLLGKLRQQNATKPQ